MKNATVRELIEILKGLNPNAIVCIYECPQFNEPEYSTIEVIQEEQDVLYIDDDGKHQRGDIIYLM